MLYFLHHNQNECKPLLQLHPCTLCFLLQTTTPVLLKFLIRINVLGFNVSLAPSPFFFAPTSLLIFLSRVVPVCYENNEKYCYKG